MEILWIPLTYYRGRSLSILAKFRIQNGRWPFWKKNSKKKVAYWSEMVRNAIESHFRSSKMAAGSHFVKKFQKNKSCVLIWNGEKYDRKWFSVIQNGRRPPFWEKFSKKWKLHIDLKWWEMRSKVIFGHPKWLPVAILREISQKMTVAYWFEMARNTIYLLEHVGHVGLTETILVENGLIRQVVLKVGLFPILSSSSWLLYVQALQVYWHND